MAFLELGILIISLHFYQRLDTSFNLK